VKRLARSVYSRAAGSPALRRPLDAIRTHPRVRALARRHVQLLLGPGTTWANVDSALRLLAEGGSRPVAFGPWAGDRLTELLYWNPFVRWAQEHFSLRIAAPGDPNAVVFPSGPVLELVEEYRRGVAAPRPLLKRTRHARLAPGDAPADGGGRIVPWSEQAVLSVLAGVPTIAVRPTGAAVAEPDLDLAQRVAAELGIPLTILDSAGLQRLTDALR
jgi:hypothetical protein